MNEIIIDRFVSKVSEYFKDNPDVETFEIGKGALSDMVGVCLNLGQALSQTLAFLTISVQDLRGKISIERNEFLKFADLRNKVKEERIRSMNVALHSKEESFGLDDKLRNIEIHNHLISQDIENKKKEILEAEERSKELEKARVKINSTFERLTKTTVQDVESGRFETLFQNKQGQLFDSKGTLVS